MIGSSLPKLRTKKMTQARPKPSRPLPPAPPSPRNDARPRKISLVLGMALAFFVGTTFLLGEMLPAPSSYEYSTGVHSMMELRHLDRVEIPLSEDRSGGGRRSGSRGQFVRRRPKSDDDEADDASRDDQSGDDARSKPEAGGDDESAADAMSKSAAGGDDDANGDDGRSKPKTANGDDDAEGKEEGGDDDNENAPDAKLERAKDRDDDENGADEGADGDGSGPDAAMAAPRKTAYDPRVIHILETRFMQNQPHLVQLARARLHLLRAVCLPTVLNQTAWGQFVWVIRTDPELNDEIKEELVELLDESGALVMEDDDGKERALTYVVGSNDNYIVANSTTVSPEVRPFDIRSMLDAALSKPESIFAGKPSSMQMLREEVSSRSAHDVILWTRLDADDGLNVGYMEYLQSQAVRYFLPEAYDKQVLKQIPEKSDDDDGTNSTKDKDEDPKMVANDFAPPQWTYWCSGQNVDWFLTDPVHDPDHKNGTVYAVMHSNVCVTPGVTVAMRGTLDPLQVPRLDHDKIISYLRSEGGGICERKGLSVFDEPDTDDDEEKEEEDDGTCFHMVSGWMSAVRSRTPTSAGMMGVVPDKNQLLMARKMPKITGILWKVMKRDFSISNEQLMETNAYFAEHVYDIAEENASGQCTTGHSCKTSSKDLLQQFVDLKSEMGGGIDIIDGRIISNTHKEQ